MLYQADNRNKTNPDKYRNINSFSFSFTFLDLLELYPELFPPGYPPTVGVGSYSFPLGVFDDFPLPDEFYLLLADYGEFFLLFFDLPEESPSVLDFYNGYANPAVIAGSYGDMPGLEYNLSLNSLPSSSYSSSYPSFTFTPRLTPKSPGFKLLIFSTGGILDD